MREIDKVIREITEEYESGVNILRTRFSITLASKDNKRIEALAKTLRKSKQELINNLLMASMTDLEIALGLAEKTDKGVVYTDEYKDIIGEQ